MFINIQFISSKLIRMIIVGFVAGVGGQILWNIKIYFQLPYIRKQLLVKGLPK